MAKNKRPAGTKEQWCSSEKYCDPAGHRHGFFDLFGGGGITFNLWCPGRRKNA